MSTVFDGANNNTTIKSAEELAFVVFCIENLATKLCIDSSTLYETISGGNDIMHNYIVAGYDFLHTQDKEYILNDITQEMQRQGVRI